MLYLDYNAAAPMKPAVLAATAEAMEHVGHPASRHRFGRSARKRVEEARARVAALVGASPAQVFFASDTAVDRFGWAWPLPPEDPTAFAALLRRASGPSPFVLPMVDAATGALQPVRQMADLALSSGHVPLVDLTQALGRLPVDFRALGVPAARFAASAIGGPPGCCALIAASSMILPFAFRPTRDRCDNVPAIVGFGVAAQLAVDDLRRVPLLRRWRDELETALIDEGDSAIEILARDCARVATTTCFAHRGVRARDLAQALDRAGFAVGLVARRSSFEGEALSLSFGWQTQAKDLRRFLDVWRALISAEARGDGFHSFAA
jgi:cysteine desulfurase